MKISTPRKLRSQGRASFRECGPAAFSAGHTADSSTYYLTAHDPDDDSDNPTVHTVCLTAHEVLRLVDFYESSKPLKYSGIAAAYPERSASHKRALIQEVLNAGAGETVTRVLASLDTPILAEILLFIAGFAERYAYKQEQAWRRERDEKASL